MDTWHEDRYTFLIIISLVYFRMRNVSEKKSCGDNQNTRFMFNNFFFHEICAVHETMWKNIVESVVQHMTVWRMRIACWLPKVTNTHSEYVILIPFPLQQWLHERAAMLRCTYVVWLVMLTSHLRLFSTGFSARTMCAFLLLPIHATLPSHLFRPDLMSPIIREWLDRMWAII